MSYKNKKSKKSGFNQLKRSMGLMKTVLLKKIQLFMPKKEAGVLRQTVQIMEGLRTIARTVRDKNKKIDVWVDQYIEECLLAQKPIIFLTQWCFSVDFEQRYAAQGNRFVPTQQEKDLAFKEIPRILVLFEQNNCKISWWITFNRSYLDSGRMRRETETAYQNMIQKLFEQAGLSDKVMILNWEDDVLLKKPEPNQKVLENLDQFLSASAFDIVYQQHVNWARNEAGLVQTDEELKQDVRFQIACEAEEGRMLCDEKQSPFEEGKFILVPLEVAERYNPTFLLLNPDLDKRIVSVLKPYPWRFEKK